MRATPSTFTPLSPRRFFLVKELSVVDRGETRPQAGTWSPDVRRAGRANQRRPERPKNREIQTQKHRSRDGHGWLVTAAVPRFSLTQRIVLYDRVYEHKKRRAASSRASFFPCIGLFRVTLIWPEPWASPRRRYSCHLEPGRYLPDHRHLEGQKSTGRRSFRAAPTFC